MTNQAYEYASFTVKEEVTEVKAGAGRPQAYDEEVERCVRMETAPSYQPYEPPGQVDLGGSSNMARLLHEQSEIDTATGTTTAQRTQAAEVHAGEIRDRIRSQMKFEQTFPARQFLVRVNLGHKYDDYVHVTELGVKVYGPWPSGSSLQHSCYTMPGPEHGATAEDIAVRYLNQLGASSWKHYMTEKTSRDGVSTYRLRRTLS